MKQPEHDLPAKVLIVDDEQQITRVLRTALSTQGYSLRVAASFSNWEHRHSFLGGKSESLICASLTTY